MKIRRFLRSFFLFGLLLGLLGSLWGLVWLMNHPESPWLERATGWPLVGPLAEDFREAYLPPPSVESAAAPAPAEPPEIIRIVREPKVTGVRPMVWLRPGQALRQRPEEGAAVILGVDRWTHLPEEERRGTWVRVRFQGREGWIEDLDDGRPPLPAEPLPVLPLPGQVPGPERLQPLMAQLGLDGPSGRLGPYDLYTDLDDEALLAHLDRVASAAESAYQNRFGLELVGEPAEAIAIFAREGQYRLYQGRQSELVGLTPAGHAAGGLVVLYAGGRARWEIAQTVLHEIGHLLNRRAVGPALPPWLDEGLAELFSMERVDEGGRLVPGSLGGRVSAGVGRRSAYGPPAQLHLLRRALDDGRAPAFDDLFGYGWRSFVEPARVQLHYAQSAFLLRFLLYGDGAESRQATLDFLKSVSRGGPATGEALLAELGARGPGLRARFATWVRREDRLAAG